MASLPSNSSSGNGKSEKATQILVRERATGLQGRLGGGYEQAGRVLSGLRVLAWGTGQMMDAEGPGLEERLMM